MKKAERRFVGLTRMENVKRLAENGGIVRRFRKERHAGVKLEIVRTAEDGMDRRPLLSIDETRKFHKPGTEQAMPAIGFRLVEGCDCIGLRHRAGTQPGDLREDEPHPVRTLLALPEFMQHIVIDTRLRIDEALQIKGV